MCKQCVHERLRPCNYLFMPGEGRLVRLWRVGLWLRSPLEALGCRGCSRIWCHCLPVAKAISLMELSSGCTLLVWTRCRFQLSTQSTAFAWLSPSRDSTKPTLNTNWPSCEEFKANWNWAVCSFIHRIFTYQGFLDTSLTNPSPCASRATFLRYSKYNTNLKG